MKKGQSFIEGTLIIILISIACFFALQSLSIQVETVLNNIAVLIK